MTATPATTKEQVALMSSLDAMLLGNMVDCWKQMDLFSYDGRQEDEKFES